MTTPQGTAEDTAMEPRSSVEYELAEIRTQLNELVAAVDGLRAYADKADEFRRLRMRDMDYIDQLHRDNDTLRKDQLTSAMKPLLNGFVKLYDLMTEAPDEGDVIGVLRRQLVQILELNGVTVYAPELGEAFDSKWHSGVSVPADRPEAQDATVARVRRAGFQRSGMVVRPAQVDVYRVAQPNAHQS